MPDCENCGGNKFTCTDGVFICEECHTQSQDLFDEQAPEFLADSVFSTKGLKKRNEKDKSRDFGRAWYTVEGYQLVIKSHINALIRIGVDPAIDGVMKQIWFKYVHLTNMAVIDTAIKCEDVPDSCLSYRDYFYKYCGKDDPAVSSRKLKLRYIDGGSSSGDEWFSVDTGASADEEEDPFSTSSHGPAGRSCHHKAWAALKVMSLNKVIAFCYLALRWMGELFTVGDLIHWAESGRIPYYDAGGCFPSDMKLYRGDDRHFVCPRTLKYDEIRYLSRRLQPYIGMPELPNVDVTSLVGRYLHQLNLPLGFIPYASRIAKVIRQGSCVKRFRTGARGTMSPRHPDLVAASVVVILLKLCFVLDGVDEWSMNFNQECCTKHKTSFERCHPFSWKRWIQQHLNHSSSHTKPCTFLDPMSEEGTVNLHTCMEHYLNVVLKGVSYKTVRVCNKIVHFKEITEMRQLPFKRLAELQGSLDIIDEKYQERMCDSNVKLLGRRATSSSGCLTSACVNTLLEYVSSRNENYYVHYREPLGNETLNCYPSSYTFVLFLLMDVTKAHWKLIHEYIVEAEASMLTTLGPTQQMISK